MEITMYITSDIITEMELALGDTFKTEQDVVKAVKAILEGWLSDAEEFPED